MMSQKPKIRICRLRKIKMSVDQVGQASTLISDDETNVPEDILLNTVVVDIAFHPSRNVIAAGTVDGVVKIYSYYAENSSHELMSLEHHKKSCRAVEFSRDGSLLFTASKDKSIQAVDMETGTVVNKLSKAHKSPLYSILCIDDYLIASGDEEGQFKVWDYRRQQHIMSFSECKEYISDLAIDAGKKIVLATSGEGTLTAFNIRARRMEIQSELFDSEFLSVAVVKSGSKALVGSGDGALNIFNCGEWGNISDRFPGHPDSVDSILAINDDIICTGCSDGNIRVVQVLPNRFIGIVGSHEFPVENLSISGDGSLLASCSHDQSIKFWSLSRLDTCKESTMGKADKKNRSRLLNLENRDFFSGFGE